MRYEKTYYHIYLLPGTFGLRLFCEPRVRILRNSANTCSTKKINLTLTWRTFICYRVHCVKRDFGFCEILRTRALRNSAHVRANTLILLGDVFLKSFGWPFRKPPLLSPSCDSRDLLERGICSPYKQRSFVFVGRGKDYCIRSERHDILQPAEDGCVWCSLCKKNVTIPGVHIF